VTSLRILATNLLDSLAVPSVSPEIIRERNFIEAASRISSFHLVSSSGHQITPLEMRLTKDRMDLVASILSQTPSAYQHLEPLLELIHKLGFHDDVTVEIRLHTIAAQAAMYDEQFETAANYCCTAVTTLESRLGPDGRGDGHEGHIPWPSLVKDCWQLCFQIGKQQEYKHTEQKLILLSHSLRLCPPDQILRILAIWRQADAEQDYSAQLDRDVGRSTPRSRLGLLSTMAKDLTSSRAPLHSAANIASQTLNRVTAGLPFSAGQVDPRLVSGHARHALSRGIGWLIGNDDHE
jgi:neuroblastoma-amplified sequence